MKKSKFKGTILIIILFILSLIFMTVGFARYNKTLNLGGTTTLKPDGKIYISGVTKGTHTNATSNPQVTQNGEVEFNLSFRTVNQQNQQYVAVFNITITNDSSYDYVYNIPNYTPTVTYGNQDYSRYIDFEITGISQGQKIPSKTSKTVTATFTFEDPQESKGTYTIGGSFSPDLSEDANARLIGEVDTTIVGDLRGNNELALFTIDVMNTYNVRKTFTIEASSDRFVTRNLDNTGTPQYEIAGNTTSQIFSFYLAKKDGAEYFVDREKVTILLVPTGETGKNADKVTVLVDITQVYIDETPPTISNVEASILNTNGSATVTWEGEDDTGGEISSYTIIAYRNGTEATRQTVNGNLHTYTFTGLQEGNYYFTVFGTDASENHNAPDADQISRAQTTPGYACRSADIELKWRFRVTFDGGSRLSSNGPNYSMRGDNYTTTISVNANSANDYTLPTKTNVNITMGTGANQVTVTNFDYSTSTGVITINDPTIDDITIQTEARQNSWTCLVEGTKILLANGEYKNIEDITYIDLLKVYNHVKGGTTEVYPIWIEEGQTSNVYRKITFSDGAELKTVNHHCIFDVDQRKYVDVSNDDECKIGTRVYKLENDELKIVSVTNIEDIYEEVKYYNVISTIYYNIIANGLLTTENTSSLSNYYGFEDNAIYGENYYKILNAGELAYEDVKFIPHYLYKGLNLKNATFIIDTQFNPQFISNFVNAHTISPITYNGEMFFIVTTSEDKVNLLNLNKYLHKEGSTYQLPKEGAKYYIETSTNKEYQPGETIKVENSIHFKAVN